MTTATRRELAKVLRRLRRKMRRYHPDPADYEMRSIDAELSRLKPKRSKTP